MLTLDPPPSRRFVLLRDSLEAEHVPMGCGVWPAWWTRPRNATFNEIDIAENINSLYDHALAVLHTKEQCSLTPLPTGANGSSNIAAGGLQQTQSGTYEFLDCSFKNPDMTGCRAHLNGTDASSSPQRPVTSWGDAFNAGGGGFFAMQRNLVGDVADGVRIWSWQKGQEPQNIRSATNTSQAAIDTSTWGEPAAFFDLQTCQQEPWGDQMIVSWATSRGKLEHVLLHT